MIGEGLYECGSCGHRWNPGEVLSDLADVVCEMCHEMDVFVQQVRKGYARGVAHATARAVQEQATQRAVAGREGWVARVLRLRDEEAEAWRVHYERKEAEVRAANQEWEAEQRAADRQGRTTSDG
jgi:hypothetical protein